MSRLIVKNLPKTLKAKTLEDIFSSQGTITDLQLKYTKDGVFRQFAFVGYKTEEEAQFAKKYFNNTFVNTSKIQVDICTNLNEASKPRSWRKEIAQAKQSKLEAESKEKLKVKDKSSSKKKKIDEIPEELLKDAKFKEFLEVNKDRKAKPVWAEDINVPSDAEAEDLEDGGSSSDSDYDLNYKELNLIGDDRDSIKLDKEKKPDTVRNKSVNDVNVEGTDKSPNKKQEKSYDDQFTVKLRNLHYACKKKQIKEFFRPLKIKSLRLPRKGFAYVMFTNEKDMKQALIKNKSFINGHRVEVIKYTKKDAQAPELKHEKYPQNNKEQNEELIAETGRIYVRNLCSTVTDKELEELFTKYGPLAEVNLPIDFLTKKAQGFAFISFVFSEHAVKAFTELDGRIFQGRVLHLIPAEAKKEYKIDENDTNFKKQKEAKLKEMSGSSHNWNILFLGMNAVSDVIAKKYNVEKSKLLSGDTRESVAVRMALAETEMVMENRKFLIQNGVCLDAFSQADAERSKTVIVVKHLPANTDPNELLEKFSKFGTVSKVILPPSGMVALIDFENPTEAKAAFRRLAYSRFHNLPLYLEWAPINVIQPVPVDTTLDNTVESTVESEENKVHETANVTEDSTEKKQQEDGEPPEGTTVFVKNLNFGTTEENLQKHFKKCGPIHYASISTKKDIKTGKMLSMGFGFVQFNDKKSAVKAVQNLQQTKLDGHALEIKFAKREIKPASFDQKKKYEVKKQLSAKILVRNIPFQASEREVKDLFAQFGMIKFVRLPMKLGGNGEHRGFGFVEYHTKDNAERAFNALCHSTHFFGRKLVLEWANTNSEDVEELRKKTAKGFVQGGPKSKVTKKKLNEDVTLAASRFNPEDD